MKNIYDLKIYRKRAGCTQTEIAALLNIHRSNYSRKESGKAQFTLNEFTEVIKYLRNHLTNDDEFVSFINSVLGHYSQSTPEEINEYKNKYIEALEEISELNNQIKALQLKIIKLGKT